jgi:hypothetical protein
VKEGRSLTAQPVLGSRLGQATQALRKTAGRGGTPDAPDPVIFDKLSEQEIRGRTFAPAARHNQIYKDPPTGPAHYSDLELSALAENDQDCTSSADRRKRHHIDSRTRCDKGDDCNNGSASGSEYNSPKQKRNLVYLPPTIHPQVGNLKRYNGRMKTTMLHPMLPLPRLTTRR